MGLTKAEMRKRLQEAKKKVGLVFLNQPQKGVNFIFNARDETLMIGIMRDLEKLIQKVK